MKKIISFFAVIVIVLGISSFTEDSEGGQKHGCDASNNNPCKIEYKDGSKVDATGKSYIINT